MSGYLSHIAALSLNKAEVVQPRLPGMFESTEKNIGSQVLGNDADEMTNNRDELTIFPQKAPVSKHEIGELEKSELSVVQNNDENQNKPKFKYIDGPQHSPQIVERNEIKQSIFETQSTPLKATANSSSIKEPQTTSKTDGIIFQSENSRKPSIERIVERTVIELKPTLLPKIEQNHTDPLLRERVTQDVDKKAQSENRKLKADTEDVPKIKAVSSSKIVVEPHIQSYTPPKEYRKIELNNYDSPAPTIQVTIGRIEIRATQNSDSPLSKPRPASTTMSLDEYLSRRNGGNS